MGNGSLIHKLVHSFLQNLLPDIVLPLPLSGRAFRGLRMGINLKWEREFVYGKFEFEVIKAIQDFVKPGNVVYDVGAHVGYFTLLMAKLVGPRGYCFAFEPSPQISRRLEENIRKNRKKLHASIQIMEMALFDEVGKRDFFWAGVPLRGG